MDSRIFKYEVRGDEDSESALRKLPAWRLEKALAYRRPQDRFLCAEAYLLLKEALAQTFGYEGEISFEYGPYGKPSLKERPDIRFNLSHCRSCVACIVSSEEVGIDVEDIQYDEVLARKVFNAEERRTIAAAQFPDVEFTKLWTMKESLLKLKGTGLRDDLKELLTGETPEFTIETGEGYVLCAAEKN